MVRKIKNAVIFIAGMLYCWSAIMFYSMFKYEGEITSIGGLVGSIIFVFFTIFLIIGIISFLMDVWIEKE